MSTEVTIYHNPDCGTSRNTLALIRNASASVVVDVNLAPLGDHLKILGGSKTGRAAFEAYHARLQTKEEIA